MHGRKSNTYFQANECIAGPPPLSDLIALLNPRLELECRSDVFNISRNSEHFDSFDYAALAHHVEVLGRVLMNIPEYVAIEKRERARSSEVFAKSTNELSKLQTVKELLDRLGNNIGMNVYIFVFVKMLISPCPSPQLIRAPLISTDHRPKQ